MAALLRWHSRGQCRTSISPRSQTGRGLRLGAVAQRRGQRSDPSLCPGKAHLTALLRGRAGICPQRSTGRHNGWNFFPIGRLGPAGAPLKLWRINCLASDKEPRMNILISVLITFLVIILVLYLVNLLPLDGRAKHIVRVIVIVIGIISMLKYLAVF
jgi:hypothetical protein